MKPPVVILAGVRWDFLWQRHQTLATLFADAGYPTVFVETTGLANPRPEQGQARRCSRGSERSLSKGGRPPAKNLDRVRAAHRPADLRGSFVWANERFFVPRVLGDLGKIAGSRPVVVAYPPTRTTLDLVSGLDPRLVLYDCSDDYEQFPGAPRDIARTERELLLRADLVSCTSQHLLEKARRLRPDAFLSGPAVDYERFAALQSQPPARGGRDRLLFRRRDRGAHRLPSARRHRRRGLRSAPRGRSRRRREEALLKMPGVDYRGEVSHAELPGALAGVDAFVLPYRINALTAPSRRPRPTSAWRREGPSWRRPSPRWRNSREYVYLARRRKIT